VIAAPCSHHSGCPARKEGTTGVSDLNEQTTAGETTTNLGLEVELLLKVALLVVLLAKVLLAKVLPVKVASRSGRREREERRHGADGESTGEHCEVRYEVVRDVDERE
jgi:hypothetical protein